jgi:hypothetical protein
MIDKVVGKELFEEVEIGLALNLVCVATNDRLCGLADVTKESDDLAIVSPA